MTPCRTPRDVIERQCRELRRQNIAPTRVYVGADIWHWMTRSFEHLSFTGGYGRDETPPRTYYDRLAVYRVEGDASHLTVA